MCCKKHKLWHSTLTHWTTFQNLFAPFYGKTASLYCWHTSITLWYSCSRKMAQTALSGASSFFSPTPLSKTSKAASLNESILTWCVTQCFGFQWWQKSRLLCLRATITVCVSKRKGCLPTQMYLEACHISSWVSPAMEMVDWRPAVHALCAKEHLSLYKYQK